MQDQIAPDLDAPSHEGVGQELPDQKALDSTQYVNHPAQYKVVSRSPRSRYVTVKNTGSGKIVTLDQTNPGDKQALADILKWKEARQKLDARKRPTSVNPEAQWTPPQAQA